MNKKVPFSKRTPPSQHAKPDFYWRGGDVLKEREYLQAEYNQLIVEKVKADEELEQAKQQVSESRVLLKEREGYTEALAGFIETDADSALEENKLKKELSQLEQQIQEAEEELEKYQSQLGANIILTLQKEKTYYTLETQKADKALKNAKSDGDLYRNNLALCMTSSRYRKGVDLEFKVDKTIKKRNYLRQMVSRAKNENDRIVPPRNPVQTAEGKEERRVLSNGIDTKLAILITEEKLQRHPIKHRTELEHLLKQIEDLNDRMVDVGCESGIVDIDKLRENIFSTNYPSHENDEEEEEAHEQKSPDYTTIDDIQSPQRSAKSSKPPSGSSSSRTSPNK